MKTSSEVSTEKQRRSHHTNSISKKTAITVRKSQLSSWSVYNKYTIGFITQPLSSHWQPQDEEDVVDFYCPQVVQQPQVVKASWEMHAHPNWQILVQLRSPDRETPPAYSFLLQNYYQVQTHFSKSHQAAATTPKFSKFPGWWPVKISSHLLNNEITKSCRMGINQDYIFKRVIFFIAFYIPFFAHCHNMFAIFIINNTAFIKPIKRWRINRISYWSGKLLCCENSTF